jgi:hypothetical protein
MRKLIRKILTEEDDRLITSLPMMIEKSFPRVKKVYITTRKKHLGSSPELSEKERTIDYNIVNVVLDNEEGDLSLTDLRTLKHKVVEFMEDIGLDFWSYGSEWDFTFYVLKVEPINLS